MQFLWRCASTSKAVSSTPKCEEGHRAFFCRFCGGAPQLQKRCYSVSKMMQKGTGPVFVIFVAVSLNFKRVLLCSKNDAEGPGLFSQAQRRPCRRVSPAGRDHSARNGEEVEVLRGSLPRQWGLVLPRFGHKWILEPALLSQKITNAPISFVKARATVTLCPPRRSERWTAACAPWGS